MDEDPEAKGDNNEQQSHQQHHQQQKQTSTLPVGIQPKNVYGLRLDVKNNIHFTLAQEVIYPVEGVLAFHDYVTNKQRFMRFPDEVKPEIIAISPSRKLLAVMETCPKNGTYISIYDLNAMKKRRHLTLPDMPKNSKVVQIFFTFDSKSVVLLTSHPDEMIFIILLDKTCTTYEGRPTIGNLRCTAECIAVSPQDAGLVAVCGMNLVLLMGKSDKGLTISQQVKTNIHATTCAFLAMDLLVVGTNNDELILIENGEWKYRQKASAAETLDILWDQEGMDREIENRILGDEKLLDTNVTCLTAFSKGFAFAIFNKVYVFERISKFRFERKTVLNIPITIYPESLYQIKNLAVDGKMETVIVTTRHAQIYVGILIVPETLKTRFLEFQPLGALIHIGDIVDLSICAWKPIIMTASKDQTVRIWNYETEKVELVRKFQVDVNMVELNSTGNMAAIGFSDQLRITQIFMDELNIVKTYNFPHCKDVKYSNFGHLMAAAFDNTIALTSVYKLEVLLHLKGHNGTVLSIAWSQDDKYLISGGAEGAIYQWDVSTGTRIQEIVQKGTEYRCVCVTGGDPLSIYAATNWGVLREFQKSELVREVVIPSKNKSPLVDVCLARSDMVMFVTDEDGDLFNVQLPFMDAGGGVCNNFRFFTSRINKMRFSYDGTLLITISRNGTLAIWILTNIDGRVAVMDQDLLHSKEVLIPRDLLYEKNEQIATLELRLKQQAEEFQYQLNQNEIFDGQQLAEVHRSYCQALEELKNRNNEIEQRHTEEMNQITFQINDLKEEHRKQLDALSNQYSERMLIEYQKFTNLRDSMLQLRESYEGKLKKSAGTLQDTVEGLESDYQRQLDERKELIRELMREMEDKKIEFVEYCRQVEVENDRNMVETQLKYENKLTNERNETQLWRGKAGVLEKKYETLCKDVDTLLEEVETLKEEHTTSQKTIAKLNRDIADLQKDISDRDYAINAKEVRIQDLLHKNQELDKYKQVLGHQIAELKAQIEPREFQINDKRKHILEIENELAGLNQNNAQLELQLKELTDKYISNIAELKVERDRARAGRECIQAIRSDIYNAATKINYPSELKSAMRELFQRHASDDELKRHISHDAEVRDEFQRQRAQMERVLQMYKSRTEDSNDKRKYKKLLKENIVLLEEIDKMRKDNDTLRLRLKKDLKDEELQGLKNKTQKTARMSVP